MRRGYGILGILGWVLVVLLMAGIALGEEVVPQWVPDDPAAVRSHQDGLWSNPATWGGVTPTGTQRVIITHTVVADRGKAGEIYILGGSLLLDGELHAHGSVVVYGQLAGAQGRLMFHVPNDRLFTGNTTAGPAPQFPDFHPQDIGLWVMPGGDVRLIGPLVTAWVEALPEDGEGEGLKYGGTTIPTIRSMRARVASLPVGWQAGDTLLLTAVGGDYALATMESLTGDVVTFTIKDRQVPGDFLAPTVRVHGVEVRPKIANLSRRVAIIASDVREGDVTHRAHVAILHEGNAAFEGVEFRNLGPRGKLGRYPIHFHHTGATGGRVEQSTIWQEVRDPGNRFIAVHNTQNVILKHNVGLRSQGHGIFFETGEEINNHVEGNLTVDVRGPEELSNIEIAQFPLTYHYWVRSRNVLTQNIAVGTNATPTLLHGLQVMDARTKTLKPVTPAIGVILLPHRLRHEAQTPAVMTTMAAFGTGLYGYHIGVPGAYLASPIIAFALQSGNGPSILNQVRLTNPVLLYNGEGELTYPSQLYLSSNRDVVVEGGVFVGKVGVHIHYLSNVVLNGTAIRGQFLLAPTYWNLNMRLAHCDMHVETLFQGAYPRNRNTPGLLRVEGCTGTIKGTVYPPEARFSADFTGETALASPLLAGTEEPFRGKRLTTPVPPSGFVRMGAFPRNAVYSVTSPGKAFAIGHLVAENEDLWQSLASVGGYPHGFPPGSYHIKTLFPDGRVAGYACDILSGQVTDLSACAALNMAHLKLVLRQEKSFVEAGDSVSLVVAVDNTGTSVATNATIIMDVPSGLTIEETTPSATVTYKYAYQLRWNMGRIEPGRHPTLLQVKLKVEPGVFRWSTYANMVFSVNFCTDGDGCEPTKAFTHTYQDGQRTVAKHSLTPAIRLLAPAPGEIVREGLVTVCYDTSGDMGAAQAIDWKVDGKSIARDGEMAGMYALQNLLPGPRRLEAVLIKKDGGPVVAATEFFVQDLPEAHTTIGDCMTPP